MFDINSLPMTFLGANSAGGFASRFAECYSADDGWRAYIIKGGPGTGKSSLMKQVAALLSCEGDEVELCPCSSDPDSLDAVIIHNKKAVIMDGTAPHTVDPAYPGACETIINLSDCWDAEKFSGHEAEIIATTRKNKQLHAQASRYITAACGLIGDTARLALDATNIQKTTAFAKGLAGRLIRKGESGSEKKRFLSGITPKGLVFYRATVTKLCKTVIALEDEYGAVSDIFMNVIREEALRLGQDIYTCYSTFSPEKIDHILIPSLSLAFCLENRYTHPEGVTRRIHARRFTDNVALSAKRTRITFNRRAADELLREAVAVIAEAKRVHDILEEYYINAMDFSLVGKLTEKTVNEIKKR